MSDTKDRAVRALIADAWLGEWERPVDGHDLSNAVALVLRTIRDDLVMAEQRGEIRRLSDVEEALNERIFNLTGRQTVTGDTT
jgi:hypothetical protein